MALTLDFKQKALAALIESVREERNALTEALKTSVEATTHSESKAEDMHDTRAIEASYLTAGQSKRALDLDRLLTQLEVLSRKVGPMQSVQLGALIELKSGNTRGKYFFLKEGGGISATHGQEAIRILTPQSQLGEELAGLSAGDSADIETQGQTRTYEILSVI